MGIPVNLILSALCCKPGDSKARLAIQVCCAKQVANVLVLTAMNRAF